VGEADEWLVSMAREDPEFLPAGVAAGEVLMRSGRFDELEQLLGPMEAAHPRAAEVVLLRSEALVRRGELGAARDYLRSAVNRVGQPEQLQALLDRLPEYGPPTDPS
jgi:hypothetical protein